MTPPVDHHNSRRDTKREREAQAPEAGRCQIACNRDPYFAPKNLEAKKPPEGASIASDFTRPAPARLPRLI